MYERFRFCVILGGGGSWDFIIFTTFKIMFLSWFANGLPPTKINTSTVLVIPFYVFQNALCFICCHRSLTAGLLG